MYYSVEAYSFVRGLEDLGTFETEAAAMNELNSRFDNLIEYSSQMFPGMVWFTSGDGYWLSRNGRIVPGLYNCAYIIRREE